MGWGGVDNQRMLHGGLDGKSGSCGGIGALEGLGRPACQGMLVLDVDATNPRC